jgi:cytochrome c553
MRYTPRWYPRVVGKILDWIQKALTKYPADKRYKSAMEATYHRTRNATAAKIAKSIWRMYNQFRFELHLPAAERAKMIEP